MVGSIYVCGDKDWCGANLHTAAFALVALGYAILIPVIVIVCVAMAGDYAVFTI